jgi:hypothetical protein
MATKTSSSKTTTEHEIIRKWVEERGGRPATVKGTGDGEPGILRIDYPGRGDDDALQELSWDEFFEKFDSENLAFLYQEQTADGEESRFSKFVSRDNA